MSELQQQVATVPASPTSETPATVGMNPASMPAAASSPTVAEATSAAGAAASESSGGTERKLKQHPLHIKLFDRPGTDELQHVYEQVKASPSSSHIDVLPNDQIVCGAHVFEAMNEHPNEKLPVTIRVRNDLVTRNRLGALQCEVLRDNLTRAELPPGQKAYAITQLYSLETSGPIDWENPAVQAELRTKLSAAGLVDSELDAYLRLPKAPEVVQRAVARGILSMEAGIQIAEAAANQETAKAITKLVDAFCKRRRDVDLVPVRREIEEEIAAFITFERTADVVRGDPLREFVESLTRGVTALGGKVKTLDRARVAQHVDTLKESERLITKLLQRAKPK